MKTFGLIVPAGKGRTFEKNVRNLLADQSDLAGILLPMLDAWHSIRTRAAALTKILLANARQSHACRLLMTIPGVGAITATALPPPADITRLLEERPDAIGLAVPGMPIGSPGMDFGDNAEAYDIFLVKSDGITEVFSSYPAS